MQILSHPEIYRYCDSKRAALPLSASLTTKTLIGIAANLNPANMRLASKEYFSRVKHVNYGPWVGAGRSGRAAV